MRVKFNGGREVEGVLKGWDQLMNLVLDEGKEVLRGMCDFVMLFSKEGRGGRRWEKVGRALGKRG